MPSDPNTPSWMDPYNQLDPTAQLGFNYLAARGGPGNVPNQSHFMTNPQSWAQQNLPGITSSQSLEAANWGPDLSWGGGAFGDLQSWSQENPFGWDVGTGGWARTQAVPPAGEDPSVARPPMPGARTPMEYQAITPQGGFTYNKQGGSILDPQGNPVGTAVMGLGGVLTGIQLPDGTIHQFSDPVAVSSWVPGTGQESAPDPGGQPPTPAPGGSEVVPGGGFDQNALLAALGLGGSGGSLGQQLSNLLSGSTGLMSGQGRMNTDLQSLLGGQGGMGTDLQSLLGGQGGMGTDLQSLLGGQGTMTGQMGTANTGIQNILRNLNPMGNNLTSLLGGQTGMNADLQSLLSGQGGMGTDLTSILSALTGQGGLGSQMGTVNQNLSNILNQGINPMSQNISTILSQLQGMDIPGVDLSGLTGGQQSIMDAIGNIPGLDLSSVMGGQEGLGAQMSTNQTDLTRLLQGLSGGQTGLGTQMGTNQNTLTDLLGGLSGGQAGLGTQLGNTRTALTSLLGGLQSGQAGLGGQVSNSQAALTELLGGLQGQMGTNQTSLAELLGGMQGQMGTNQSALTDLLGGMQGQMGTNQSALTDLLGGLSGGQTGLGSQMSTNQNDLTSLLGGLQGQMGTNQTSLTELLGTNQNALTNILQGLGTGQTGLQGGQTDIISQLQGLGTQIGQSGTPGGDLQSMLNMITPENTGLLEGSPELAAMRQRVLENALGFTPGFTPGGTGGPGGPEPPTEMFPGQPLVDPDAPAPLPTEIPRNIEIPERLGPGTIEASMASLLTKLQDPTTKPEDINKLVQSIQGLQTIPQENYFNTAYPQVMTGAQDQYNVLAERAREQQVNDLFAGTPAGPNGEPAVAGVPYGYAPDQATYMSSIMDPLAEQQAEQKRQLDSYLAATGQTGSTMGNEEILRMLESQARGTAGAKTTAEQGLQQMQTQALSDALTRLMSGENIQGQRTSQAQQPLAMLLSALSGVNVAPQTIGQLQMPQASGGGLGGALGGILGGMAGSFLGPAAGGLGSQFGGYVGSKF